MQCSTNLSARLGLPAVVLLVDEHRLVELDYFAGTADLLRVEAALEAHRSEPEHRVL
jgi:hypothetical protein